MRTYNSRMCWLIGITTLIRIIFSLCTELGNVEVYYWSWSLIPQLNYIDHPPIVALMIYATTLGQLFVNEFSVRMGPVIAAALCTWVCFKIGKQIKGERAGWYLAILYATCVYTSIGVGIFVLPDSPQMVFWLVSLLLMLKLSDLPEEDPNTRKYWLLIGITCGLCIMCKVHGAAIWFGILLYCLLYEQYHFKRINIYIALGVTLLIISPVIVWNFQHDWYTWKFQSSRFVVTNGHINFKRFLTQLTGVVFSFGPIHFFLIWRCIYFIVRGKASFTGKQIKLILCCSLPLIIFFFIVSIFREVYSHWPCPAYTALLILPALEIANNLKYPVKFFPKILIWSAGYCLTILLLQVIMINYIPGTTSSDKEGINTGTGDATVDMVGWKETGKQYKNLYTKSVRQKSVDPAIPILVTAWTPAAAIDFYLARQSGQQVLGVGGIDSLHQYYLMNSGKKPLKKGQDAFYVIPSNYLQMKTVQELTKHFYSANNILTVPIYRNGFLCKETYIFLLKNYDGKSIRLN